METTSVRGTGRTTRMLQSAVGAARYGDDVVVFGHDPAFLAYMRDIATGIDAKAAAKIKFEIWRPDTSLRGRTHVATFVDHFAAGVP